MEVLRLLEFVRARRIAGHGKPLHLRHCRVLLIVCLDLDELSVQQHQMLTFAWHPRISDTLNKVFIIIILNT